MKVFFSGKVKNNSFLISCIKACLILILLVFSTSVFAQTRGKLEVVKDPLIDTLIARRIALSKHPSASANASDQGYRVQFYSGSDRKEAYAEQARFQKMYPQFGTYIIYVEPNYKIRAGDFRTRLEAQKLMNELRPDFPSLFIISDKINPLKSDPNAEN